MKAYIEAEIDSSTALLLDNALVNVVEQLRQAKRDNWGVLTVAEQKMLDTQLTDIAKILRQLEDATIGTTASNIPNGYSNLD